MKFKNKIILLFSIILFFLIGIIYDINYRTLTRTIIYKVANYDLQYYGGKEIRLFVPDLGFILTLIPIGLAIILSVSNFKKYRFIPILIFPFFLISFYLFFCFLESQIIKYTTAIDKNSIYHYHHSNVNYKLIAISTIISSLILDHFGFNIIKKFYLTSNKTLKMTN
ncbi:hypothetical protein SAMN05444397_102108 [Flavobacterium aquidurense]|uniref:Uncharacterized protein n=1 Tax=Flavobacterium frigidimaris TaxID=262320 RepID=A0ABX4BSI8_FLAFR|nr:hypothetical protein [Flavobacterium frigidimaris]OXA80345.1 hypothetical protein B0A65_06870 [Flavobacterium frigidimaris]SDY73582.1 hypothetical protein SAMN05444397_102108 [Flavobacterium aquidurense]